MTSDRTGTREEAMDSKAVLTRLAKITGAGLPMVSVYLNTRWADEQQRERVRVLLKNELRKARQATDRPAASDLDWIQAQGESLIEQARFPDAHGVALFACEAIGLREVLAVRVPFEDAFVIADTPYLRPLAERLEEVPAALVVFVDSKSARLIPLDAQGPREEVTLESDVPGHHRRGGWAQLAQSRYERHIEDHRDRHFEAVAEALVHLADGNGIARVVTAGEPHVVSAFRKHLPQRLAERVVGNVSGGRHESASAIVARAAQVIAMRERAEERVTVEAVITEAAKGGRAVAGVEPALDAVNRAAVHRLYLLRGFQELGRLCPDCRTLQPDVSLTCQRCGRPTKAVEMGEAMVDHVIASGGTVEVVDTDPELRRVGGVAARLRYPI